MSKFYVLPRFDPAMLANKNLASVAFGTVSDEEADGLMNRHEVIRRGFGEEVELETGDSGLVKDSRGRWTLFRIGGQVRSPLAEAAIGPIQQRGPDDTGRED